MKVLSFADAAKRRGIKIVKPPPANKKPMKKESAPVDTSEDIDPLFNAIGGDPALKERIKMLFGELGKEREKRFGGMGFAVMYSQFKKDFRIGKNDKWTVIWDWHTDAADMILKYIESRLRRICPNHPALDALAVTDKNYDIGND